MMNVDTAESIDTSEIANETPRGGAVAVVSPPRLPWHPSIGERFGVDRASWKALVEAVFPAAKTADAVVLALSYCRARKLDPFKRVVHIVPVWDSEAGRYVETVWPGIAEHRITAIRTKTYAGADAAVFGEPITQTFKGATKKGPIERSLTFPGWAQLTVYRLIEGQRVPVPGPRVYWLETYSKMGRAEVPNDRWCRAPFQMIEKCAEAAALRRAFPEELGDEATAEEAGAHHGPDHAKDVTPTPPRPQRIDFTPPTAADEAAADRAAIRVQNGEDPVVVGASMGEVSADDVAGEAVEPMPIPMKGGKVNLEGDLAVVNLVLNDLHDLAALAAFDAANRPSRAAVGGACLMNFARAITEAQKRIAGESAA